MPFGRPNIFENVPDTECFNLLKGHILKHGPIKTVRVSKILGTRNYRLQGYQLTIHKDGSIINLCDKSIISFESFIKVSDALNSEVEFSKKYNRIICGVVGRVYSPEWWRAILHDLKFPRLKAFL